MTDFRLLDFTPILLVAAAVAIAKGGAVRSSAPLRRLRQAPYIVLFGGGIAFLLFGVAMFLYPGAYNPCMKMLSVLGRTHAEGVDYPACHYLFSAGLVVSAFAAACFYPALTCFAKSARGKAWIRWGGAVNAAGLLIITLVPENVNNLYHNAGCVAAVGGGGVVLLTLTSGRNNPRVPAAARWGWLVWCVLLVGVFGTFQLCHRFKVLPYAPYVPTCQKLLILTFAAWLGNYALRLRAATITSAGSSRQSSPKSPPRPRSTSRVSSGR